MTLQRGRWREVLLPPICVHLLGGHRPVAFQSGPRVIAVDCARCTTLLWSLRHDGGTNPYPDAPVYRG